jgi:ABC-type sugar transport system ATPase subunit
MASISLRNVRVVFSGSHVALPDLTLDVGDGERLVLVGASGSGKSTVLRSIAGLEQPAGGRILVGDRDVTDLPPEQRDLAMVFQSYALYPHMTVRANLGFGLRMRGLDATAIRGRVDAAAAALGIAGLLDRRPAQLSGGERQRVALGRAMVRQPQAFLFDEPLSNLDPRLRGDVRAELVRLHNELQATMVYVTHDQEEAMTLGQRIAVLRHGRIEQIGTPQQIYDTPINTFVATFIGSPPMNLLKGRISEDQSHVELGAGLTIALPHGAASSPGGPVQIGIRPHDRAAGANRHRRTPRSRANRAHDACRRPGTDAGRVERRARDRRPGADRCASGGPAAPV